MRRVRGRSDHMERRLKFNWNCWSLNEDGSSQLVKKKPLNSQECLHLQKIHTSTWNMTWGENTKSSEMEIDTVRCVGPSHTLPCRNTASGPLQLQSHLLFTLSLINILWGVRRGEVSSWQKWAEKKLSWGKLLNIITTSWGFSPRHSFFVDGLYYTLRLFFPKFLTLVDVGQMMLQLVRDTQGNGDLWIQAIQITSLIRICHCFLPSCTLLLPFVYSTLYMITSATCYSNFTGR